MTDYWEDVDEQLQDLETLVEMLRHAWASDQLPDAKRLEQLRYLRGKTEWSVVTLGQLLDEA